MYDGLIAPEGEGAPAREDPADDETVRSGTLGKLRREITNLWRRAPAGVEPPPGLLNLSDVPDVVLARDLPPLRRRIQALRHFALNKPGDSPPGEPPSNEPAEPPKPASGDPEGNGKPPAAPPAGVDEKAEYRRAMKSLREDAVVWSVIADSRAFDPQKLFETLRPLSSIDESGNLSLVDPNDETKTLALDAATLRRLLPAAVAAPAGVTGGSGGGTPNLMPRAAAGRDLVERATRSQKFFDEHRAEVTAELQRRQREGGE